MEEAQRQKIFIETQVSVNNCRNCKMNRDLCTKQKTKIESCEFKIGELQNYIEEL